MSFMEQIDKQLQKLGEKVEAEKITDKAHVAVECPNCNKIISVHRMRARYGYVKCTECGELFVVKMVRK